MKLEKIILIFCTVCMIFIFACQGKNLKNIEDIMNQIELEIILEENIISGKEIPITFAVTNKSSVEYKISDLRYFSNLSLILSKNGELIHGKKIKPILSNRFEYVDLKAGNRIEQKFNYNLNEIFPQLGGGEYLLTVIFIGNIIDHTGHQIVNSNELKAEKILFIR